MKHITRFWRNVRWYSTMLLTKVSPKHRNADLDFLIREITRRHA